MAKTERTLTYEEFARHLPEVLDELANENEVVLVKRAGRTFSIEETSATEQTGLPPTPPPDVVRRILRETAGGFHTPDREAFLEEIREARGQDSEGRPA